MLIVTKHGNRMMKATCPQCRCEFLYQQNDVQLRERRVNAYESETEYVYLKCPECNGEIKI